MEDVGGPDLEEGQDVDFDIEQAPKGPRCSGGWCTGWYCSSVQRCSG